MINILLKYSIILNTTSLVLNLPNVKIFQIIMHKKYGFEEAAFSNISSKPEEDLTRPEEELT